jgi:LysM repeat protein
MGTPRSLSAAATPATTINQQQSIQQKTQKESRKDQMKVSKVVLMVVALHVLVIGGIFIFEGCTRAKAPATVTENDAQPSDITPTNSTLPTVSGPDANGIASMTPVTPANTTALAPTTATSTVAPTAPAPVSRTYTVKSGDTLTKIAKAEKITITELSKANHLTKTSVLKVGQKLTIPAKAEVTVIATATPVAPVGVAGTTHAPAATAAPVTTEGASYTVQSGDSLWKIAKSQNSSVAAIKQANNLASDSLKVGQKIVIPAKTATTLASATPTATAAPALGASVVSNGETVHTIDIGESPATIAKKYGVSVSELMKANNITDPRRLQAGRTLRIPVAQPAVAPAPVAAPAPAAVTATAPSASAPAPAAPAPAVLTAAPMAN